MNILSTAAHGKVLIQGITGPLGALYANRMRAYGTPLVAGVSSGYGGQTVAGVPVFDIVEQALEAVGRVETSVIFVDPYQAVDAALEAIAANIRQIVLITEGVPPLDMVRLIRQAELTDTLVVGPDCPGLLVPGQTLLGTFPTECYKPGCVGLLSRSSTLTHEVALQLTQAGLGQSIAVGIGGGQIVGSSFPQWLQILEEDESTRAIVLVGEIGSDSEEAAARYITEAIDKPVVVYVAGQTVPQSVPMSHAGAIVASLVAGWSTEVGTVNSKIAAFQAAGVPVADRPSQVPILIQQLLAETS